MKLAILNEYGVEPVPHLEINMGTMREASHNFFGLINKYFEGSSPGWSHSRVETIYKGKTISVSIRQGINVGSFQGEKLSDRPEDIGAPRVSVKPSWDGSVEMRLDVPREYRESIDWPRERRAAIGAISMQIGDQLKDAVVRTASNIISKMQKSGKVSDYP